jgi:hypothetical protein
MTILLDVAAEFENNFESAKLIKCFIMYLLNIIFLKALRQETNSGRDKAIKH